MMFFPTRKQLKDIYPLSCLSDSIVAGYYPGNTVVIAMSHPANFCVGHFFFFVYRWLCALVFFHGFQAAFVDKLCRRGIPLNSLFFYYHGVVDKVTGIIKG